MNGVVGLNILGDKGMSNEGIALYTQQLKASTHTVINNPKLARMLLDQGSRVIYRHKSDQPEGNDDDAHLRYDPVAFVDKRHAEAPLGCVLYLTNEPGTGNIPVLNSWTLAAMKRCDELGRKACILNFSTGNPQEEHWEQLAPSLAYSKEHHHINGHHDYFNLTAENSLKSHVGHCLNAVREYGGDWVITELGCAVNYHPEVGWSQGLSEEAYAEEIRRVAEIYWLSGIPVCIYSYGAWFSFGIEDAQTLKQKLVEYNRELSLDHQVQVVIRRTSARVNVRTHPSLGGKVVTTLNVNTPVSIVVPAVDGGTYSVGSFQRNDWYVVKSPADGYIAAAYCIKL